LIAYPDWSWFWHPWSWALDFSTDLRPCRYARKSLFC